VPEKQLQFVFDMEFNSTQFFVEVQLRGIGFPNGGTTSVDGEHSSPLPLTSGQNIGEVRINSDHQLARDARTACTWQSFANNQPLMASSFKAAMEKLALVGQSTSSMIDCSEAVPVPLPAVKKPATLPAGKSMSDIEQACATAPFPTLATDRE
jgi:cytochrome c peroxidase